MFEGMKQEAAALILAGGFGTRVRHVHPEKPKALIKINGQPFLYWILSSLEAQGFKKAYILAFYKKDEIFNYCQEYQSSSSLEIIVIVEPQPLGTGGAVKYALETVNFSSEKILLLNGDTFFKSSHADLLEELSEHALFCISGTYVESNSRFGLMEVDASNHLIRFNEKVHGDGLVNIGRYAFDKHFFLANSPKKMNFSLENEFIPRALEMGKIIKVKTVVDDFLDIGTEETLASADTYIQEAIQADIFAKKFIKIEHVFVHLWYSILR